MTTKRMRKPNFVSPWRYDPSKNANSITGGKGLAQPGMSLSVREIMLRFTRGVTPLGRQGGYNEEFVPDYDRMDLTEQDEYREQNAQRIKDLQALSVEAKREAQAANERGPNSDSEPKVTPSEGASKRSGESDDQA